MANKNTITLQDYLSKTGSNGRFVIPNYQRGYVWGQYKPEYKVDSVSNMINTLLDGYRNKRDIFVQGITVYESSNNEDKDIYLVDGQQRTTFFYLLLKWLGWNGHFSLNYAIREKSQEFLSKLIDDEIKIVKALPDGDKNYRLLLEEEPYQDIYFFRKTLLNFRFKLRIENEEDFTQRILKQVHFLYIPIKEDQADIIFTMMNGQKAKMKQEELVKSELLRCSSLSGGKIGEAENVMLRNRFAREWDQWMYWWNKPEVFSFFHTRDEKSDFPRIMGWLLPLSLNSNDVSFEDYREKKLKDENNKMVSVREAKAAFKDLRLLQKQIEDAFLDPITHNYIGAILCWRDSSFERFQFLNWYFKCRKEQTSEDCLEKLTRYFDWSLLHVPHKDIEDNNLAAFEKRYNQFYESLSSDALYRNPSDKENLFRWLLCRNILEDNEQGENKNGRIFDFEIWRKRSLEHIFCKSKVWHLNDNGFPVDNEDQPIIDRSIAELESDSSMVKRDDILIHDENDGKDYRASEHSIGNLVLLYKRDNSEFSIHDFERKKQIFFGNNDEPYFKSRHLIHTIKVFAHSEWTPANIVNNKYDELDFYCKHYSKYLQKDEAE